jgi:hypothetical protein
MDAAGDPAAALHDAPKSTTPSGFSDYLARRWNEGCTMGKQLLAEIRTLRYTGSLTHLQRLLNGWRRTHSRRRSERQRLSLPLRFRISSRPRFP